MTAVALNMAETPTRRAWTRFRRNRAAMFGACLLAVLALSAIFAGAITAVLGLDAEAVDLASHLSGIPSYHA